MIKRYSKILIGVLVAAIIAIGAFAGVSIYTDKKEKEAQEKDQKRIIYDFRSAQVKSLKITNTAGSYVFERSGDGWIMTDGDDITLSRFKLDTIADALSGLTADHILSEDDSKAAAYGLDGRMIVTAVMNDNSEKTVEIGTQVPGDSRYYARVPGDSSIYLLSSVVVDKMWADRNDLRDAYMFDVNSSSDVKYLKYIEKGKVVFEVRNNGGVWDVLDPPVDIEADASGITGMLTEIIRAQSVSFIDENASDSEYGFDHPQFEIVLESENRKADYIFGSFYDSSENFIYAKDKVSGQISVFQTAATGCYGAETEDVMFKRLHTVTFEEMDTFDIDLLGTKIDVVYHYSNYDADANDYRVNGISVDHSDPDILDTMNNFINAITGMRFNNYAGGDFQRPEGDAPSHIIYHMLDGSDYVLEFYPTETDPSKYYIVENGRYLGVTVDENTFINGVLSYYNSLMMLIE